MTTPSDPPGSADVTLPLPISEQPDPAADPQPDPGSQTPAGEPIA